jgi:glycerol-3-phosphate dehydrogenase
MLPTPTRVAAFDVAIVGGGAAAGLAAARAARAGLKVRGEGGVCRPDRHRQRG